MAQPRIVEVDYYVLLDKLKAAFAAGGRIEKTDKEPWQAYVKAHNVNVTTMQAWAKVKFMRGKTKMAIINHGVGPGTASSGRGDGSGPQMGRRAPSPVAPGPNRIGLRGGPAERRRAVPSREEAGRQVPELSRSERLQPSLLDRLTDQEPAKAAESRGRSVLSMRSLRESVVR